MKKWMCAIAVLMLAGGLSAQDRLVKKAGALVEESKEKQKDGSVVLNLQKLTEAQEILTPAITGGATKDMAAAWNLQAEIYQLKFGEELNKAAAKAPFDSQLFYTLLNSTLETYDKCDEVDVKEQYKAKNKQAMRQFRIYYVYGGQFFSTDGQHEKAFEAFDAWLTFPDRYKLIAGDPALQNDSTVDGNMVAFYACLSAYNAKRYDLLNKHMDRALKYEKEAGTAHQLCLIGYLEQGDTAQWVAASRKFALEDMTAESIAQNLLAYYFEHSDFAAATSFADELLATDPNNRIANYTKGVVLYNQNQNAEAVVYFDKTIAIDPTFSDAYYNAGVCYCNQGYELNESIGERKLTIAQGKEEIEKVKAFYRNAEPYFLKVRELNPDRPERWASRLRTVYYIIGDKEKEAEMETYTN